MSKHVSDNLRDQTLGFKYLIMPCISRSDLEAGTAAPVVCVSECESRLESRLRSGGSLDRTGREMLGIRCRPDRENRLNIQPNLIK